ncbi:MAG TPA: hypothetical protein VMK12_06560 [Anaeromyxobacteraceae bacterium]|nr:hypothetical protein [Anaeromyxobacteraceae bacterium]
MIDADEAIRDALLCAREESFLWELSQSLQARFPDSSISECDAAARQSAAALLKNSWVQVFSTTWAEQSSGTVLSQAEAAAALEEPRNWRIPSTNQDPCFHLLITDAGLEQPF